MNNLPLNSGKSKEVIINFTKSWDEDYAPILIKRDSVEHVSGLRFLGP